VVELGHLGFDVEQGRAVELPVKDLLSGAQVELAVGDGHDDLAAHDLPLHVRVGVVLARVIVAIL